MIADQLSNLIRQLAKSNHWQALYQSAEKLNLRLFENNINLTDLQLEFIGFLSFYASLYMDVAMGDVDESVFDNEIWEDAYVYYRNKSHREREDITKKNMKDEKKQFSWIFKRPSRK